MQLKWLEDFTALAETRSFTRAAELRHVTHPAFGRRIRALETWAGTPLVDRSAGAGGPVLLTAAGTRFLETAQQMARDLDGSRVELHGLAGRQARSATLTTGRTLARTLVADWLVQLKPVLKDGELRITTRALAETVRLLEQSEADFSLVYHHPALAVTLDARRFTHVTVASDRLVPVARADVQGRPLHTFADAAPVPYLAYAQSLALGRLVADHLANNRLAPRLLRQVESDSADATYEYALKGIGVAWLPWSMVHADCKAGRLAHAGDKGMEVGYDVWLYRPKRRLGPFAEAVWEVLTDR
ncbi:LysR family transcriptional regulator [Rhodoferax koreense]|uniref:LysR family transcriptional regulator n=1 Tax=Rhodoferax koreensis TaxID=1842727 RepID=A0A1P8K2B1_9BURK|nr:LysR substrate-binding domain-containing protein [Rhodoferax koreense]APW40081.1 LysR family transcriptional regulator [Rhodoferax koreense]